MALTSRMQFPFPDEYSDPWFDAFVTLMNALDASLYAGREDRNIILMGGGAILFDAGAATLSWASDIELLAANTGYKWIITAGALTGVVSGKLLTVSLTRGPLANTVVTLSLEDHVSQTDDALVIGVVSGTHLYFRNGAVAQDGILSQVIEDPAGSVGLSILPFREEFVGTGILLTFDLSIEVNPALWNSIQVHRNGLLLDDDGAGVTQDEYSLSNVDPGGGTITRITFGAAPDLGAKLFVSGWV